ncbi:hypothetical protein QAD02_007882 [Eretmocerus hayati]|uniref:Uncharacterized protein n=1 Tax=Eretmocerus hayati TaxID=131215 RepID=A0ACC2N4W9_9HYME|nr:hypothetical protein QAD02_007882 [Eretmocerus hayati]
MGSTQSSDAAFKDSTAVLHCAVDQELFAVVARLWELDEGPKATRPTPAEEECMQHSRETHERDVDGRFVGAEQRRAEVISILKSAGMESDEWAASHADLLLSVPAEDQLQGDRESACTSTHSSRAASTMSSSSSRRIPRWFGAVDAAERTLHRFCDASE